MGFVFIIGNSCRHLLKKYVNFNEQMKDLKNTRLL